MIRLSIVYCLLFTLSVQAQKLPNTNLYLFDMEPVTDSIYQFSNPQFLSGFNLDGYNNQPYFMNEDELYVTVQKSNDTTQSDIYALDLKGKKLTRVTQTLESEFSPTYVPPSDASANNNQFYFSAVRIETDADRSQRLWKFPMDRRSKGEPLFRSINNVGYHCWIDSRRVALFIVGTPHKLVVSDTRTEAVVDIASDVGRCMQIMPNNNIAYVDKSRSGNWLIRRFDTRFYRSTLVTATLPGSEDFAITSDGTFIMGNGSKLFKFNQRKDNNWIEIADLGYYGINNITRIAVIDGKIAVVGD